MIGPTPALDWRLIGAVLFGLTCFGLAFTTFVQRLGDRKDGYTSLLVVAGVLVTLAGVALIYWPAAVLSGAAFVASGLPMIVGDIWQHIKAREAAIKLLKERRDEQA